MKLTNIREFVREDWYAWSAERFALYGGEPLICEETFGETEFTAIADARGVEFHLRLMSEDGYDAITDLAWRLPARNTRIVQKALLKALLEEIGEVKNGEDIALALDEMDGVQQI